MSEIKFDLTTKKKIKFSVSLMLLFTKLVPARRLLSQKNNLFSSHFTSIWSCSTCLGGIPLGENAVLHLENEAKSHLKQYEMQKKCRSR